MSFRGKIQQLPEKAGLLKFQTTGQGGRPGQGGGLDPPFLPRRGRRFRRRVLLRRRLFPHIRFFFSRRLAAEARFCLTRGRFFPARGRFVSQHRRKPVIRLRRPCPILGKPIARRTGGRRKLRQGFRRFGPRPARRAPGAQKFGLEHFPGRQAHPRRLETFFGEVPGPEILLGLAHSALHQVLEVEFEIGFGAEQQQLPPPGRQGIVPVQYPGFDPAAFYIGIPRLGRPVDHGQEGVLDNLLFRYGGPLQALVHKKLVGYRQDRVHPVPPDDEDPVERRNLHKLFPGGNGGAQVAGLLVVAQGYVLAGRFLGFDFGEAGDPGPAGPGRLQAFGHGL